MWNFDVLTWKINLVLQYPLNELLQKISGYDLKLPRQIWALKSRVTRRFEFIRDEDINSDDGDIYPKCQL
jgi:hypothetical protein